MQLATLLSSALMFSAASALYGDGTYYDVGLGACGQFHRDFQMVAAVSRAVYGYQPNPNNAPICYKCALVRYRGNSVAVRIVDKCMGCRDQDIDMSPAAFARLADRSLGRIKVLEEKQHIIIDTQFTNRVPWKDIT